MRALLFLLAIPAANDPAPGGPVGSPAPPAWIHCTPTTIELPGGRVLQAQNSVAQAIDRAGAGSMVYLSPGDYPAFSIGFDKHGVANTRTSGGRQGAPLVVEGSPGTRVVGSGDTIAINQAVPNAWITFRNIVIVPGQRAGIMFYRLNDGREHRGYSFEDCDVLGGFDHRTGQGRGVSSKWGIWGHSMADFRFVGLSRPARVEGIAREHGFYITNHRGSILIENVAGTQLGRTFCQFTARASEGDAVGGDITIRRCDVRETGLAAGDAYKGGSAFTFAGRLRGTILLDGNVLRTGFDPSFHRLTRRGAPYGTGALVAWQGKETVQNERLVLRDNHFEFAPGCGDRPLVSIGGTTTVQIVGKNELVSGGKQPALALDPVDDRGRLANSANGSVHVAPETVLTGGLTLRGREPSADELAGLHGDG